MKPVDLVYLTDGKGFLGSLTRAATSIRVYEIGRASCRERVL